MWLVQLVAGSLDSSLNLVRLSFLAKFLVGVDLDGTTADFISRKNLSDRQKLPDWESRTVIMVGEVCREEPAIAGGMWILAFGLEDLLARLSNV
jgi:hypothetical protein